MVQDKIKIREQYRQRAAATLAASEKAEKAEKARKAEKAAKKKSSKEKNSSNKGADKAATDKQPVDGGNPTQRLDSQQQISEDDKTKGE